LDTRETRAPAGIASGRNWVDFCINLMIERFSDFMQKVLKSDK
jgi:hypothetical protein